MPAGIFLTCVKEIADQPTSLSGEMPLATGCVTDSELAALPGDHDCVLSEREPAVHTRVCTPSGQRVERFVRPRRVGCAARLVDCRNRTARAGFDQTQHDRHTLVLAM